MGCRCEFIRTVSELCANEFAPTKTTQRFEVTHNFLTTAVSGIMLILLCSLRFMGLNSGENWRLRSLPPAGDGSVV